MDQPEDTKMKFKRIDKGLTKDGKFYRTTFQSQGAEIMDIEVDVETDLVHRDPEIRVRYERKVMQDNGISDQDIV